MINFEDRNSELAKAIVSEEKTQETNEELDAESKDKQPKGTEDQKSPLKPQPDKQTKDQPQDSSGNHPNPKQIDEIEQHLTKNLKELSINEPKSGEMEDSKDMAQKGYKEDMIGRLPISERKNSVTVGASLADIAGKSMKENVQELVEGEANPPKELPKELAETNLMRKQNEGPKSISQYGVINQDHMLKSFENDIKARVDLFNGWLKKFDDSEGGISNFAGSYKNFGLNRVKGGIQYREWAPSAQKVCLCGDFNGWNRGSHECKRNQFGVWELFVPDLPDGTPAIKHGSKVKAALVLCDGKHVLLPNNIIGG